MAEQPSLNRREIYNAVNLIGVLTEEEDRTPMAQLRTDRAMAVITRWTAERNDPNRVLAERDALQDRIERVRTVLLDFGQLDKSNQTTALEALEKIDEIIDGEEDEQAQG